MTCENLVKVECVGNWIREGIIVPKSRGGRGVISIVAVEPGMKKSRTEIWGITERIFVVLLLDVAMVNNVSA